MPSRLLRDWTDSLKFDGISAEAERLFVRLIMKADDYGRFHADPRLVRAAAFPLCDNLRTNDISRWLDELGTRGLVLRYEAGGREMLAIVNYGQRLKQSRAKFPPPAGKPEDWLPGSGIFPEVPGTSGKCPPEEKRREPEEKRERERTEPPVSPPPAAAPPFSGWKPARTGKALARARIASDEMDLLIPSINSLLPSWQKIPHLNDDEADALHGSARALLSLEPGEWELLKDYMAYTPRAGERWWQPTSRLKFLEAPADLLSKAEKWARTHRRTPTASRPAAPPPDPAALASDDEIQQFLSEKPRF